MARPYPPETQAEALRLLELGLNSYQVAGKLDLSPNTVLRWADPAQAVRQRHCSAEAKRRRRKQCAHCGKPIWYTSTLCVDCSADQQRAQRRWTRELVIKAIQDWAKQHDQPPTSTEWKRASETHPAATAIYGTSGLFRSWNEAIQAAGFTPRRSSPGPGNRSWSLAEAAALRNQGWSDKEIGERFGVTGNAIGNALGRRAPARPTVLPPRSRSERIADLQAALRKGEPDGNRYGEGNDHDRAGG